MIAIIDYDTGNLRSVANALERAGRQYLITADHDEIRRADAVILPGVGQAATAMERLRERGLDRLIPTLRQPVLGICIGMQLMCRHSQEGDARCLGIFDTDVRLLDGNVKIPHMGWDDVQWRDGSAVMYYVHSYAPDLCDDTAAVTDYGRPFSAILKKANFTGVQFHPEKSGSAGAEFLKKWLNDDNNTCY